MDTRTPISIIEEKIQYYIDKAKANPDQEFIDYCQHNIDNYSKEYKKLTGRSYSVKNNKA